LLIVSGYGAAGERACADAVIGELIAQSWVDQKFSAPFLRELTVLSDERLLSDFRIEPSLLHSAAAKFIHRRSGRPLEITHYLLERTTPEKHQAIVLFAMRYEKELVGFLAVSLQRNRNSLEAWSEYLKVNTEKPETLGMSLSFFNFTRKFYSTIGISCERLEAGWAGRPIWARMRYEFDPDVRFMENGKSVTQLEVTRGNFGRFLALKHFKVEDLYIEKDLGGSEAVQGDFANLNSPGDFLLVKHRKGKLLPVAPYIDADVLGPVVFEHPGKAFSLWDYRPRHGQTISIMQNGKALSDIAMPTWIGIYYF
jgi:hypothetical protein